MNKVQFPLIVIGISDNGFLVLQGVNSKNYILEVSTGKVIDYTGLVTL